MCQTGAGLIQIFRCCPGTSLRNPCGAASSPEPEVMALPRSALILARSSRPTDEAHVPSWVLGLDPSVVLEKPPDHPLNPFNNAKLGMSKHNSNGGQSSGASQALTVDPKL